MRDDVFLFISFSEKGNEEKEREREREREKEREKGGRNAKAGKFRTIDMKRRYKDFYLYIFFFSE